MIDWTQVFEVAHPHPGASEEEIARFVRELGLLPSPQEVADDPRFDAAQWSMPNGPLPESYLSFLRYSDGGNFQNGDRYLQMFGTGIRSMMMAYQLPQYMPGAVPFALNGGGVFYLFDMRHSAENGEYPILCAGSGCLDFDPHNSPVVARSFLEVCRGCFNVDRLRFGGEVLTATTWPLSVNPKSMLDDCKDYPRKLRLFAVAGCRRMAHLMPDALFLQAIDVAERFADGKASDEERQAANELCKLTRRTPLYTDAAAAATESVDSNADEAAGSAWFWVARIESDELEDPVWNASLARSADLLREIFYNPFETFTIDSAWLRHDGGVVLAMAKTAYEERRFDILPVLADALEDAGCDDQRILAHCRGPNGHVRGCWVLDLLLGK